MHHWIDAWDGHLAQHIERLTNALESDEEWIGNRVVRRRRISFGAALALAVVAIIVGLIFAPNLQRQLQSDKERARGDLVAMGISVDESGLASALVAADGETLNLLRTAGINPAQVLSALGQTADASDKSVARVFFENSRNVPAAIDWFAAIVKEGLDPNDTIPGPYYDRNGLLVAAIRSGNAAAVIAMLENGASPHPYQSLWFTRYSIPRFLFPYSYIPKSERFTADEKKRIAAAFGDAGAVIARVDPNVPNPENVSYQLSDPETVFQQAADRLGVSLESTKSICGPAQTPICLAATTRTGFDWCEFAQAMPKRIASDPEKGAYSDIYKIDIRNLINVVDDKAYFMATQNLPRLKEYLLVEVSKDGRNWHVYKFMGPRAGMGHCREAEDGWRPDDCWRRVSMTYNPETDAMLVENYYSYTVATSCEDVN